MTEESPNAPKKGHGSGSRGRRLRALPHWEELEVRLQHGWSPTEATEWYSRTYPTEQPPSRMTLYRFLEDKSKSWFLERLVIEQTVQRIPKILILETEAHLIQTQLMRVNRALATEAEMQGLLYPQVTREIELAARRVKDHKATQQELGILPKLTQASKDEEPKDADRELHELVSRVMDLPTEEFLPALREILGPPPVKQPLSIEGTVIEKKPLESDDAMGGS